MTNTEGELLERNLLQVWNERDAAKRQSVIESIYAKDSTFFEVHGSASGYDAINKKIGDTLNGLPGDFVFHVIKPAMINNDVGRLVWGVGPVNGPTVGTGTDIAFFKDGRIHSLYVFLDESGA